MPVQRLVHTLQVIANLRKLITPDEEEDDEQLEEESDEEETSTPPSDLDAASLDREERWQFPYHLEMEPRSLPTTIRNGKYCRIYGEYQYDKQPEKCLSSDGVTSKKQKPEKRVAGNRSTATEETEYRSHTANHSLCLVCSISAGHQVEMIHVIGNETRIWIPNRERYEIVRKKLERPPADTGGETLASLEPHERHDIAYDSDHLRSWIFTPTYGRALTGNLNLIHTMVNENGKRISYVHVLVVRPSQFDDYAKTWGSSHVILELPEEVREWYDEHTTNYTVEAGKIGYARKFIQAFAEKYQLETIFMLDDNIPLAKEVETWKVNGKECVKRNEKGDVLLKPIPLYKVLKHLEKQFDSGKPAPVREFVPHYEFADESPECRGAYTGPGDIYGVLGVQKHIKYTAATSYPFKNAHVCSLCLLNIPALKEKEIGYKPWEVWEDLHLNNDCDQKGLHVVKYNRFVVHKRRLATWMPLVYEWKDDFTRVLMNTERTLEPAENETSYLLDFIRSNAAPGRWGMSPQSLEKDAPTNLKSLLEKVKAMLRSEHHFAVLLPGAVSSYLQQTPGLSSFRRHVLAFPLKKCSWTKRCEVGEAVVAKNFTPLEGRDTVPFTVATSHMPNKYNVSVLLVAVEGKSKLEM